MVINVNKVELSKCDSLPDNSTNAVHSTDYAALYFFICAVNSLRYIFAKLSGTSPGLKASQMN